MSKGNEMSKVKEMLIDAVTEKYWEARANFSDALQPEENARYFGEMQAYEQCVELIKGILP